MDALPVLCADKNYRYIYDIVHTWTKLRAAAFLPVHPDPAQWSDTYSVEIKTVNPNAPPAAQTGACPIIISMVEKTHILNANVQKQLLSEYDQKSKIKSQKCSKLTTDKKSLTIIINGQCNKATKTKKFLGATFESDCQAGNIINFLKQLRTVC